MSPELIEALKEVEERAAHSPEQVRRIGVVVLTLMMAATEATEMGDNELAAEYMTAAMEIGNVMRKLAAGHAPGKPDLTLRIRPEGFAA